MIYKFDSVDDMVAFVAKSSEVADRRTSSWQQHLKVGDCFTRRSGGVTLYGEVLDPAVPIAPCSPEDAEEIRESASIYSEPHMKNYRFCFCFSDWCIGGEYGDVHVSSIERVITRAEFDAARVAAQGVPT